MPMIRRAEEADEPTRLMMPTRLRLMRPMRPISQLTSLRPMKPTRPRSMKQTRLILLISPPRLTRPRPTKPTKPMKPTRLMQPLSTARLTRPRPMKLTRPMSQQAKEATEADKAMRPKPIWRVRQVDEADDAVLAYEADVINKIVAVNEAILIDAANKAIVANEANEADKAIVANEADDSDDDADRANVGAADKAIVIDENIETNKASVADKNGTTNKADKFSLDGSSVIIYFIVIYFSFELLILYSLTKYSAIFAEVKGYFGITTPNNQIGPMSLCFLKSNNQLECLESSWSNLCSLRNQDQN